MTLCWSSIQEGHVKSKRLDTLSDLADLFVAMPPGFSRVGVQECRTVVNSNGVVDDCILTSALKKHGNTIVKCAPVFGAETWAPTARLIAL